jgi:hypothetical protein
VAHIRQGGHATDNAIDRLAQPKDSETMNNCLESSITDLQGALLADKLLFAMEAKTKHLNRGLDAHGALCQAAEVHTTH